MRDIPPPNLLEHLDELPEALVPGRLGLVVDFDGTISQIAPTPDEAKVSRRSASLLSRLAKKLAVVAVISGRAVAELREKVGLDDLTYVGNHGAEFMADGCLRVEPEAARYRDKIARVADWLKAMEVGAGLIWQDKTYSASAHFRLADDPDRTRQMLAAALASAPGVHELDVFWGKMVLEIRAPTGIHKGYAVRRLVIENALSSAIVLGDDTTDVDAFHALRELAAERGIHGASVAVVHTETTEEVLGSADYSLEGVQQVEAFLEWLDRVTG